MNDFAPAEAESAPTGDMPHRDHTSATLAERAVDAVPAAGLFAVTVWLGFEAGGYYADVTGWLTAAVLVTLAAVLAARRRSFAAASRPLAVGAAAVGLLALWTLSSAIWSDAPARALIEFDRVLLYLTVLLLFGLGPPRPAATLKHLPVALAAAATVLCGAGLWVRLLPGSWPFDLPDANPRMDWPVTYENALGALAAVGLIACLHVAAWRGRHLPLRIAAAAAMPVLATALTLTFSRGGILAASVGIVVYTLFGFSRALVIAVAAVALPVFLAARGAYGAEQLSMENPRSPAARDQGEELALIVTACCTGAALAMTALTRLDPRLPRRKHGTRRRARAAIAISAVAVLATAIAVAIAQDVPRGVYDRLEAPRSERSEPRDRLTNVREYSRPQYWRVSVDDFERAPLTGSGAGTFVHSWNVHRTTGEDSAEGHSVYIETLGELGFVGAGLVLLVLGTFVYAFAAGLRGPRRRLSAACLALTLAWMVHAGLDWDWEMPVLTVWLFAFGGAALAACGTPPGRHRARARPAARAIAAGACLLAAVTPAAVALSQQRLNRSVEALAQRNCAVADEAARASAEILPIRPEGYAIRAYCATRAGQHQRAEDLMRRAIRRDPGNWKYHYGMALVLASDGRDPLPEARHAQLLNPYEELTGQAAEGFGASSLPSEWRAHAARSLIPSP